MSGRVQRRIPGHHNDHIAITTTDVFESRGTTVEKTSQVTVAATDNVPSGDLWLGLKIGAGQTVRLLTVDDRAWVDSKTAEEPVAASAFERVFGKGRNQRWAAFRIDLRKKQALTRRMTRQGLSFDTRLKLTGPFAFDVADPDAQVIPIAVCYVPHDPASLARKDILLGHSVVPAAPKRRQRPRRRKS